ncbi:MAG: protein-methionine-sulfoxide reductase catalytic subunit MsrP [Firmicutes bacterium]|nr:protein-methionine-sulfoxide reductase catalytic subunit MsrP [Bacillota bacterium]
MLIRIPKPWTLPERSVTPEQVYHARRRFLQQAALAVGAGWAAPGLLLRAARQSAPTYAPLNAPRNPRFEKVEGRPIAPESIAAGISNFYEFTMEKERVHELAARFRSRPWQVEVKGHVEKPFRFDVDDLLRRFPLEERVYRHRCVEAWSIVVPWVGFPLRQFVEWCRPTARAKYLRMVSFYRPQEAPGQREMRWYPWPYYEALRLDEAVNELALLVVGSYGHLLPNQNGAPLRLIAPWKYGFKSIKSITVFEFTEKRPRTFWNDVVPQEYDFAANVNPRVPHPRWSQATEHELTLDRRIPTLPYNGYEEMVAHLYR